MGASLSVASTASASGLVTLRRRAIAVASALLRIFVYEYRTTESAKTSYIAKAPPGRRLYVVDHLGPTRRPAGDLPRLGVSGLCSLGRKDVQCRVDVGLGRVQMERGPQAPVAYGRPDARRLQAPFRVRHVHADDRAAGRRQAEARQEAVGQRHVVREHLVDAEVVQEFQRRSGADVGEPRGREVEPPGGGGQPQ